jgi:hypothetical protein
MALWPHDVHGPETQGLKRGHGHRIFENPKFNTSFLIGIGVGLLVPQAAAWCGWRLQRFMKTPRSTAFCPVEDLRRAAGMVC